MWLNSLITIDVAVFSSQLDERMHFHIHKKSNNSTILVNSEACGFFAKGVKLDCLLSLTMVVNEITVGFCITSPFSMLSQQGSTNPAEPPQEQQEH